jgi:tetratricopeptide (TPR) repeat protein
VYDRSDDPNRCFALLADWLGEDARTEELRRLVEHHQLTAPDDSLLIHYQGRIAELEEDWETAASMYRRELEAADVAAEGNARFHLVHALYKAGRIEEALESVPPLEETANQLANYLEADEDLARLKELLQKGGELLSETARTYFEAWVLYSEKQYAASAEQLRAMVTTRSPEEPYVGRMQHLYLDNCVKLGTGLEAYRDLPDPEVAFFLLASRYVEERQADELRQLIEVHQQGHPSGRNLDYFQGEAAVLEEQWETAIAAFRRELERSSDEYGSWRERQRLVALLDERGRWREAYETIEPASTVFSQLAWRMFHGERADDLESLLEMRSQREQTEEDAYATPFWEAQLDYLRGDYVSAARRYEEHRAEIARSREIHAAHEWWVATLVRLGRLDEALQQALILEAESYSYGASLSLATVHAARHDIPQTLQALAKCLRQGYSVEEFYDDKLLGSLLTGEALAEVRERYPPPEE